MQIDVDILLMDAAGAPPEVELLPRLHPDEQARYRRFGDELRRQNWRAGRALALTALEQRSGAVDAVTLRTAGSGGVRYSDGGSYLNLSHSHGLVGVALAAVPVGFDLEWPKPRLATEHAARVFAPEESRWLDGLAAAERQDAFHTLWTLKEAACKAAELSIMAVLKSARFDLPAGRFAPAAPLPAGPWTLLHARLTAGWHLALALQAGGTAPAIRCRRRAQEGGWKDETLLRPAYVYAS